jgi:hypothetical protein
LSGSLPSAQFENIGNKLTPQEQTHLFEQVRSSNLKPFEKVNAQGALDNVLSGSRVPQKSELKLLERIFGPDLTNAIVDRMPSDKTLGEKVLDVANVPKTLISSFDLSAPLRQGWALTLSKPKQAITAFADSLKAFANPDTAAKIDAELRSRPTSALHNEFQLYLPNLQSKLTKLGDREENFMSNLAEKIPVIGKGVKASERAYVTYLNKLRADVFDSTAQKFSEQGIDPNSAEGKNVYGHLARWINIATGRGEVKLLGKDLSEAAPFLNAALFSPRLNASRVQLLNPVTYAKLPPQVRQEAIKSMVAATGAAVGLISLAKAGGADVSVDPRSSDFLKIKVGNQSVDILGGFQQFARLYANLATGQVTTNGVTKDQSRAKTAGRFLRSKLSPDASLLVDLMAGQDFAGRPFDWKSAIGQRTAPLVLQDIISAIKDNGAAGGALALPGIVGAGVQTSSSTTSSSGANPNSKIQQYGSSSSPSKRNEIQQYKRKAVR